jgi:hypothetical protein
MYLITKYCTFSQNPLLGLGIMLQICGSHPDLNTLPYMLYGIGKYYFGIV